MLIDAQPAKRCWEMLGFLKNQPHPRSFSASCDYCDDVDDGHGRPWQAFAALATSCTTRATKNPRGPGKMVNR